MSPDVERLYVAARRYCAERFAGWTGQYQRLVDAGNDRRGPDYTPEALRTFPRYQVLDAIRTDLERLTGTELDRLDEARETFALAGLTAVSDFTSFAWPEAQAAMQEERVAFARFVREVSAAELATVEPLPFARVLAPEEAERVWDAVERAWGLERRRCWYPLTKTHRADVSAFRAPSFLRAVPPEALGAMLAARGITRVWQLREYGPESEVDATALAPHYHGAEGVWTSPALDWIVYASHEASITVGGWLLDEVKRAWPEWEPHLWHEAAPEADP